MKILKISTKLQKIKLRVESNDDLWYLKNFIEPGDFVKAMTPRSLFLERNGEIKKIGKKMMLIKIEAEKIEFQEHIFQLRIIGKIIEAPENVQLNSYHTIDVRPGRYLTIIKKEWKKYQIDKLRSAEKKSPNIMIVVMDLDQATFGLLKKNKIELISEIKNPYSLQHEENKISEYYKKLADEVEKYANQMKNIVIAGPGFTKEHVVKILRERSSDIYKKLSIGTASSSTISGINEIVKSGIVGKLVDENKLLKESKLVEEFFIHLKKDDGFAIYKLDDIRVAEESGAISKFIISEEKIKDKSIEQIARLIEERGGEVFIISPEHDLGEQFHRFGGIGAILRFKLFYK